MTGETLTKGSQERKKREMREKERKGEKVREKREKKREKERQIFSGSIIINLYSILKKKN